jgi:DNA repair exonuclease SbcCD ATPase subunit
MNKEIAIYHENIQSLTDSINAVINAVKTNKDEKLKELKEILNNNKDKFTELTNSKSNLEENIKLNTDAFNEFKLKLRDIDRDINSINEKIDLYKEGKCPTCHTELIGELNLLPEYEERLKKTNKIKEKTNKISTDLFIELEKTKKLLSTANIEYNKLYDFLSDIKSQQKFLKEDDEEEYDNIDEFKNNLSKLKDKVKLKETEYLEIQKLKYVYDILLPVWGETGIKRDIIEAIIDPLNEYIKEDIECIKMQFKVVLDNNFDAHIFDWGQEIDPDTLSTGEAKRVNLIIMLAYVKMLRLKSNINVLFLDEVFSGIDLLNIDLLLDLFKRFAIDRQINIILVHHTEMKEHIFDKVIAVNKSSFSYLEERFNS